MKYTIKIPFYSVYIWPDGFGEYLRNEDYNWKLTDKTIQILKYLHEI
jgi:hypothetical protein